MNSNRPAMWRNSRVPGITGLVLLTFLASAAAQASEKDELASVQRQLDQVQASLERARVAAAQADPADRGRRVGARCLRCGRWRAECRRRTLGTRGAIGHRG